MTDILLIAAGAGCLLAALARSRYAFGSWAALGAAFPHHHASPSGRAAECGFWFGRHLWRLRTGSARRARAGRAFASICVLFLTLAVPVVAIAHGDEGVLGRFAPAAAAGALVWGCVLEFAGLPERVPAVTGRELHMLSTWYLALVLLVLDVVVSAVGLAVGWQSWVGALLLSAALTALADIASFTISLAMCAEPEYPLDDPSEP